jgi:hypothetical protein
MNRPALSVLLLAAASCAGPSVRLRAPTGEFQPLEPGLEWIYEADNKVLVRRTAGLEKVGRFECRVVESRLGDTVERSWMRWDAEGLKVYRIFDGARTVDFEDPQLLIHRLGAPGAKWTFTERHGPMALAVEARYERDEEVGVGPRAWKCARIRLVKRAAGRIVVDQTSWYAKEVGLVRMVVRVVGDEGEKTTTIRLTSFNFLPE